MFFYMQQFNDKFTCKTKPKSLNNISGEILDCFAKSKVKNGLCTIYIKHTSASLIIQENADPDVLIDIENFFNKLVPQSIDLYKHRTEGPDDMPAHIRSLLTCTSLSIPIQESSLALGIWQGIFLFEHRDQSFEREIIINIIGE